MAGGVIPTVNASPKHIERGTVRSAFASLRASMSAERARTAAIKADCAYLRLLNERKRCSLAWSIFDDAATKPTGRGAGTLLSPTRLPEDFRPALIAAWERTNTTRAAIPDCELEPYPHPDQDWSAR